MIVINLLHTTVTYLKLQQLNQFLLNKSNPFLILSQVDPVFTVGLRSLNNDHLRNKSNIPVIKTNRGGQVTFHGPGQLLVYPIISLREHQIKVKDYIGILEDIVIDACAKVKVKAIKTCDTGVWISKDQKVASIGIHVSKGKTSHGFALNCNLNLKYFDEIVPCGLSPEKTITSLSKKLEMEITPLLMSPFIIDACSRLLKQDIAELNDAVLNAEIKKILF